MTDSQCKCGEKRDQRIKELEARVKELEGRKSERRGHPVNRQETR